MPTNNCCICYPQIVDNCNGCPPGNPCPPPPKCPTGNCLYLPHFLIGSENSVGPCNETGFIPFADSGLDTSLCGSTTPVFSIVSKSNIFKNVTIDSTGIHFTTTTANGEAPMGVIEYSVSCGLYSSISSVTIILKNLCVAAICPAGTMCNKCNGLCEPLPGDLSIGKTAISFNKNNGLKLG